MKPDEIRSLFDRAYAQAYDDKFLHLDIARSDREFEEQMIRRLLPDGGRWLDVACGTGYFLSRFPQADRMGTDLSAGMLEEAKRANPDVPFAEWDFRDPRHDWLNRWDLVTCMWYAYGYVDTLGQVVQVVDNLADWTAPTGTLMLPYSNPRLIARANYPYETTDTPWPGRLFIDGIIWSYLDDNGEKCHVHQMSPTPEFLQTALSRRFERVEDVKYPPALPGWDGVRSAFIASRKIASPVAPEPRFRPMR